ncbi:magnesium chelatase [Candidatus Shapirobacteria bacterium CG09_land_8_20_14_0_10_38_17]|uniref:Magnesium chelatase n=1 Tax=Candidatus Shapirobacteria bacterium CG09_land_8_20_14_0_10_38_17 TaxID=1974884 RepID=A0A2H0WSZ4_9BACT|nr:MAG: magnesium chelatase [Candidatus Shapirobacteria bacterium CG09_land_8_20_14_0_10_38_17]
MLARVISGATLGLEVQKIEVEVDATSQGFPTFKIVGLPDKAVEEAKERIRTAVKNSGVDFPDHKVIINLAPADLPKVGPSFDLPMALGILIASGQIQAELRKTLVLGELSLDGSVRRVNGVLPMVMAVQKRGFLRAFIPRRNSAEAAIIEGIDIYPVETLKQLLFHFQGIKSILPASHTDFSQIPSNQEAEFDLADIVGQDNAKRALIIAAAGGHNLFMKGPPGAGKTMLARALPGILPVMTKEEALEVTKIYSISGNLSSRQSLVKTRPFRSPHHTISRVALVGGGAHPLPGEISLAHRGALFLDEFAEFPRNVLEALRQPMEDGRVTVSRAAGTCTFPAKFILIAAANPCPCGYLGDPKHECHCSLSEIARYRKRISGPMIDRIDLHLEVPAVEIEKLTGEKRNEEEKTSNQVRKEVEKARLWQQKRFAKSRLIYNAEMGTRQVKQYCHLSSEAQRLLNQAANRLGFSARAYYRLIKVGRTIADLQGEEKIAVSHIAEALQYRAQE